MVQWSLAVPPDNDDDDFDDDDHGDGEDNHDWTIILDGE